MGLFALSWFIDNYAFSWKLRIAGAVFFITGSILITIKNFVLTKSLRVDEYVKYQHYERVRKTSSFLKTGLFVLGFLFLFITLLFLLFLIVLPIFHIDKIQAPDDAVMILQVADFGLFSIIFLSGGFVLRAILNTTYPEQNTLEHLIEKQQSLESEEILDDENE